MRFQESVVTKSHLYISGISLAESTMRSWSAGPRRADRGNVSGARGLSWGWDGKGASPGGGLAQLAVESGLTLLPSLFMIEMRGGAVW